MRRIQAALIGAVVLASPACAVQRSPDPGEVRRELEVLYERNRQAFLARDVVAVMALRDSGFHTETPDGQRRDRAAMRLYTEGILNGIDRWISIDFHIDSLVVVGAEARAIVKQHLVRMALRPDQKVHHVETWVTQREVWVKRPGASEWRMFRVDSLRDQRRLVDGKPD